MRGAASRGTGKEVAPETEEELVGHSFSAPIDFQRTQVGDTAQPGLWTHCERVSAFTNMCERPYDPPRTRQRSVPRCSRSFPRSARGFCAEWTRRSVPGLLACGVLFSEPRSSSRMM